MNTIPPGRQFKFYKPVSSSVLTTTTHETSLSHVPVNLQPNFCDPVDLDRQQDVPLPARTSVVARICSSLRRLRERCASKVPCIDRFLSPMRKNDHDDMEDCRQSSKPKVVRYRRPKSFRQLQMTRSRAAVAVKLQATSLPNALQNEFPPVAANTAFDKIVESATRKVDPNRNSELRPEDQRLLLKLGQPRIRPRKMYTPDGKVIHYVVPCHSDSSLSDHQKQHKMIQVNTESLMKLQQSVEGDEEKNDKYEPPPEACQQSWPVETLDLPNAVVSEDTDAELIRPQSPPPRVKRVTFWDDLDEFNGSVIKTGAGEKLPGSPVVARMEINNNEIPRKIDALVKDEDDCLEDDESEMDDFNFDDLCHTPENFSPRPSILRSRPTSSNPMPVMTQQRSNPLEPPQRQRVNSVANSLTPCPRDLSQNNILSPVRKVGRQRKLSSNDKLLLYEKKSRTQPTTRFPTHEFWQRQQHRTIRRPVTVASAGMNINKPVLARDLTLKYGRFPKVLRMKASQLTENRPQTAGTNSRQSPRSTPYGRISNSISNSSFTSYAPPRHRVPASGVDLDDRFISPYSSPRGLQRFQAPDSFGKPKRDRNQTNSFESSGAEADFPQQAREKLKGILRASTRDQVWRDGAEFMKRLDSAMSSSDKWSLANQLLYGYLIGSEEMTAAAVRPSTAL